MILCGKESSDRAAFEKGVNKFLIRVRKMQFHLSSYLCPEWELDGRLNLRSCRAVALVFGVIDLRIKVLEDQGMDVCFRL